MVPVEIEKNEGTRALDERAKRRQSMLKKKALRSQQQAADDSSFVHPDGRIHASMRKQKRGGHRNSSVSFSHSFLYSGVGMPFAG